MAITQEPIIRNENIMEKQPIIIILILFLILTSLLQGGCESRSDSHLNLQESGAASSEHAGTDENQVQYLDSEQLEWLNEKEEQLAREREEHLSNSISNYNYILDN